MSRIISRFCKQEDGATAIEYSFIASMIVIAIIAALLTIGPKLSGMFSTVSADL